MKTQKHLPVFYTRQEVADMFDISPRTLDRWVRARKIRARCIGRTGAIRFDAQEIQRNIKPFKG